MYRKIEQVTRKKEIQEDKACGKAKDGVIFSPKLSINLKGKHMHLFETEDGDIWVCVTCGREREEEIRAKNWEYIFDRDDPVLRCKLCGGPDFEVED